MQPNWPIHPIIRDQLILLVKKPKVKEVNRCRPQFQQTWLHLGRLHDVAVVIVIAIPKTAMWNLILSRNSKLVMILSKMVSF